MKKFAVMTAAGLVGGILLSGCASTGKDMRGLFDNSEADDLPVLSVEEWTSEYNLLKDIGASLEKSCKDLVSWRKGRKVKAFTSRDTEKAAAILFRFKVARDLLWAKVARFRSGDPRGNAEENTARALICAFAAASALDKYSGLFVEECLDSKSLVEKLNEGFYNYGIEAGTFDEIFYSVTSPDSMRQLKQVSEVLKEERARSGSAVARVVDGDPLAAGVLARADSQYEDGLRSTKNIMDKKSLLLPELANILRQNALSQRIRNTSVEVSKDLYLFQGWLFHSVSDIKGPGSPPIDFNPRQVAAIKARLKPGDLIFTYTAGYMSNVFLPGKFKHGIVYIGLPEARRALKLKALAVPGVSTERMAGVRKDIDYGILPTGYDADVIEAVAEGVKFSSLDYLMKTHINRMVVFRPRISDEERREFLVKVFALRGSMYDFDFDFEDATYQCCTEVIYRALNGKGKIDFPLKQRLAVKTLSADDIIEYHCASGEELFDVVLLAEENPHSSIHGANLMLGGEARKALKQIMSGNPLVSSAPAGSE